MTGLVKLTRKVLKNSLQGIVAIRLTVGISPTRNVAAIHTIVQPVKEDPAYGC